MPGEEIKEESDKAKFARLEAENAELRGKLKVMDPASDAVKEKMAAGLTYQQAVDVLTAQAQNDERLAKLEAEAASKKPKGKQKEEGV